MSDFLLINQVKQGNNGKISEKMQRHLLMHPRQVVKANIDSSPPSGHDRVCRHSTYLAQTRPCPGGWASPVKGVRVKGT